MHIMHKDTRKRLNNCAHRCTLPKLKRIRAWTHYGAGAIAVMTLLWATSGCKKSQETEKKLVYEPEKVAVWFDALTTQTTIDSIISSGNFEIDSQCVDPTYQSYTLRLPPNMSAVEASSYLDDFSPVVLVAKPACSGTDVYLCNRNICVPAPDSNGNCPDGFVYDGCASPSRPYIFNCVKACLPEDMQPQGDQ